MDQGHVNSSPQAPPRGDEGAWVRYKMVREQSGILQIKSLDTESGPREAAAAGGRQQGWQLALKLCTHPGVPSLLCIKVRPCMQISNCRKQIVPSGSVALLVMSQGGAAERAMLAIPLQA